MTQTKFLITGATGATGGDTVRQLLEKQHAVRVFAHRPDERSEQLLELGAEVVFGDFLDFDSVRAALNGVQRAYFCYPISPGLVQATAQFRSPLSSRRLPRNPVSKSSSTCRRYPRAAMRKATPPVSIG